MQTITQNREVKAMLFKNWSDEDFSYPFDKCLYEFKAGTSTMLPSHLAEHFAKHLVDREMNKMGLVTDAPQRNELLSRCFTEGEVFNNEEQFTIAKLNSDKGTSEIKEFTAEIKEEEVKEKPVKKGFFCEECGSKGFFHKKSCSKYVSYHK
jgi:hypothetical protein